MFFSARLDARQKSVQKGVDVINESNDGKYKVFFGSTKDHEVMYVKFSHEIFVYEENAVYFIISMKKKENILEEKTLKMKIREYRLTIKKRLVCMGLAFKNILHCATKFEMFDRNCKPFLFWVLFLHTDIPMEVCQIIIDFHGHNYLTANPFFWKELKNGVLKGDNVSIRRSILTVVGDRTRINDLFVSKFKGKKNYVHMSTNVRVAGKFIGSGGCITKEIRKLGVFYHVSNQERGGGLVMSGGIRSVTRAFSYLTNRTSSLGRELWVVRFFNFDPIHLNTDFIKSPQKLFKIGNYGVMFKVRSRLIFPMLKRLRSSIFENETFEDFDFNQSDVSRNSTVVRKEIVYHNLDDIIDHEFLRLFNSYHE